MDTHHLQDISGPLQKAFLMLKTKRDVFRFLRDLLTQEEIIEFSQRLDIAQRLTRGATYKEIEQTTGASSTTIARVAKSLHGEFGGYRQALKR